MTPILLVDNLTKKLVLSHQISFMSSSPFHLRLRMCILIRQTSNPKFPVKTKLIVRFEFSPHQFMREAACPPSTKSSVVLFFRAKMHIYCLHHLVVVREIDRTVRIIIKLNVGLKGRKILSDLPLSQKVNAIEYDTVIADSQKRIVLCVDFPPWHVEPILL
jgi:hypothetical protein